MGNQLKELAKMKIVEINAVYGEKSTGVIVSDIRSLLSQNEIDVIIGYQKSNVDVPNGIQIGNVIDWKLHALLTRLTGCQAYMSRISTYNFLKKLDKIKPDVIHLHNVHANFINLPMILGYCARHDVKTIITLHDCWFFTGKCFHFFDIGCEKYQHGCGQCPKKKLDIPNYLIDHSAKIWNDKKKLFHLIDKLKIVGCSEWISELALKSDIFHSKDILTIHNGIDVEIFRNHNRNKRSELGIDNKFVILGMAGKWLEPSNKMVLSKIVTQIPSDAVILLIGCTNENIKELTSYHNVITMGYINDRNELASIYSAADVFINLTTIDNLPTVNMESICCGTPVICYNKSGGGQELIKEGETGFVVPKWNAEEILRVVSKLMNCQFDRSNCEKVGRRIFSREQCYLKYLDLIRSW